MSLNHSTVYGLFRQNFPENADKTCIIDPDRSWTYAQVSIEIARVCQFLSEHGVSQSDRVVVQVRKGMREVAAMLAISKLGGVFVNVNTAWTVEQLLYVIEDSSACAAILEPFAASVISAKKPTLNVLVSGNGVQGVLWDDLNVDGEGNAYPVAEDDLAAIIYTSGSTGKPKGVMLSHHNIVCGAESVALYLELTSKDRLLSVLPYSFDYGLNQLTTMLLMGGTIVHQPVAMVSEIAKSICKHEVTGFAAVPPLWIQFFRLLQASGQAFPSLRYITNSGGKIPLSTLELIPQLLPNTQVYLMYGLTEAFRSTFLPPEKFGRKMGAIGRAIPNSQVFVIKEGIGVAGPGEQGELVHHGPLISQGYWNQPEATAEKIRQCPELMGLIGNDSVVYSGDIVRMDDDGDLWFVSRRDALIKSSGFRISPDEVEDLVHRSGMVTDVVAFGVNDDLLGQSVHIAATFLPEATSKALMAHCRQVMPRYMIPQEIHVWAAPMPRTASGKLARPEVIRACTAE